MTKVSFLLLSLVLLSSLAGRSHAANAPTLAPEIFKQLASSAKISSDEVVYLDFWASWCKPCRASFPWMNAMQEKYRHQGLRVVAVNLDQERALADAFLKQSPGSFDIVFDPQGVYAAAFDLGGMPSSYLLNSKGQIVRAHKGFFQDKQDSYEAEIVSLLESRGF